MKRGIEVIIHDTEELERSGVTLELLSRWLRAAWLIRVLVDTGGNGRFVMQQLIADGVKVEPLPKEAIASRGVVARAHSEGYELGRKHAAQEYAEHEKRNQDGLRWLRPDPTDRYQTVADWAPEAQAQRAREGWPRYHRESSALLNEQLKANEIQPKWVAIEQRIKALEALLNLRNELNDQQRRVKDLELQMRNANANVATLSQRVQCRAIVSVRRERDVGGCVASRAQQVGSAADSYVAAYHSRPGSDVFVHGSGCQLEGQESRADECIECEPVKGEPTRDENGTSLAQPPPFVDFDGRAPISANPNVRWDLAPLPEPVDATAGRPPQPPPIDAAVVFGPGNEPDSCRRRYPLDPLTAEDPCEDCGRDQRKHEIADLFDDSVARQIEGRSNSTPGQGGTG